MRVMNFRNIMTKAMHKAMGEGNGVANFTQSFIAHVVRDCMCSRDTAKKLVYAATYFATNLKFHQLYFEGEAKYLAFEGTFAYRTLVKPAECVSAEELDKVCEELTPC